MYSGTGQFKDSSLFSSSSTGLMNSCSWANSVSRTSQTSVIAIYYKIPNVSPGLIEVFKHFLGGLYSEGTYIRGGLIFGSKFIYGAGPLHSAELIFEGGFYSRFYGISPLNISTPRI